MTMVCGVHRARRMKIVLTFLLFVSCAPAPQLVDDTAVVMLVVPPVPDAGHDAGVRDAGLDAGLDAGVDAGIADAGELPVVQPSRSGSILISVDSTGLSVNATFSESSSLPSCTQRTVGSCTLLSCTGRGVSTNESAGTLTAVIDGMRTDIPVSAMGGYRGRVAGFFPPGTVVTIEASGGWVPAFSVSAEVLEHRSFSAPLCPLFTSCPEIERARAPALTWTPFVNGTATAGVVWEDTRNRLMTCTWPSTSGMGTIEPSLWQLIPARAQFLLQASLGATTKTSIADWDLSTTIGPDTGLVVID